MAVWTGEKRPDAVPKKIADEEYKKKLEEHRDTVKQYIFFSLDKANFADPFNLGTYFFFFTL